MEEKELKLDMLPGIGERPCTMERRDRLKKRRQAKRRKREIEDRILLVFAILCMISLCVAGMARTVQIMKEMGVQFVPTLKCRQEREVKLEEQNSWYGTQWEDTIC